MNVAEPGQRLSAFRVVERSAFRRVEQKIKEESSQPLSGPPSQVKLVPIKVLVQGTEGTTKQCPPNTASIEDPTDNSTEEGLSDTVSLSTVSSKETVEEKGPVQTFNVKRIDSQETVVVTPNGTMRVPNAVLQSELQRFNVKPSEQFDQCVPCKLLQKRISELEKTVKLENEAKRMFQREVALLNDIAQRREWFWAGQAQKFIQEAEFYKALARPLRIPTAPKSILPSPEAIKEDTVEGAVDRASSTSSPLEVLYSTMAIDSEKTNSESENSVKKFSEPLDPISEHYQKLLAQAKENAQKCPLYKDAKLAIRTCLFNPDSLEPMPQLVKNPTGAFLLYRKWRESISCWIGNQEISVEWSKMKDSISSEYLEWKVRSNALFEEHLKQLGKGYIRVLERKSRKSRKRKNSEEAKAKRNAKRRAKRISAKVGVVAQEQEQEQEQELTLY